MVAIEEQLTTTLTERSAHLELPAGAALRAWNHARRQRARIALVAAGVGVGLVAVGAVTADGVETGHDVGRRSATGQTLFAPTATSTVTSSPTCPPTEIVGPIVHPDPVLEAICMPDPAPGFPLRRNPDSMSMLRGALTRIFLLGSTPPVVTVGPGGSHVSVPTGPEATVFVARVGAFPTTPRAVETAGEYSVVGTTTALGTIATVVRMDGGIGVLVSVDGFDIAASGSNYGTAPAVTPAQLVDLIDGIQGLPAN